MSGWSPGLTAWSVSTDGKEDIRIGEIMPPAMIVTEKMPAGISNQDGMTSGIRRAWPAPLTLPTTRLMRDELQRPPHLHHRSFQSLAAWSQLASFGIGIWRKETSLVPVPTASLTFAKLSPKPAFR